MEQNELASEKLADEIGMTIHQYHFVYQILNLTNRICVPKMKTMGVCVLPSGKFELHYDPEFVLAMKPTWLRYVLYHEILHMVLGHCTQRKGHFENHELGSIATDLAINQLIPEHKTFCERPEGEWRGLQIEDFKKKYPDIEEKQTAEYYYDFLMNKNKESGKGKGKGQSGKGKGKGQSGKGKGKGQSGISESGNGFDTHEEWGESELGAEKIRKKVEEIKSNGMWGNVSGTAKEMIIAAQQKKIHWRSILKQFYGSFAWKDRQATRKRPNRKTGYYHPGFKKLMVDKHLTAVDTSGSVDSSLGAKFLDVMNQMVDYVPIDCMQCDSDVTVTPKPFNRKMKTIEFTGRGGTNFQPIIDLVDKLKYKSVLIFTDGEASPCTKPKNARVVWVLPEGKNPPVEWGMRVHITNFN